MLVVDLGGQYSLLIAMRLVCVRLHSELVSYLVSVDEVLANKTKTPFLCAAADSDDYIDFSKPVRLRVSAMAGDGSPLPNLVINVNLDGKRTKVPLDAEGKRGMIRIGRQNIHHNIEPDLYRFTCEYTWDGGSDKRAVLIRSV